MKKIKILFILLFLGASFSISAQNKPNETDAAFYTQKIDENLKSGKSYNVSVTFRNTGNKTWRKGQYWIIYTDPRMSAGNNNVWGIDSVAVKKNVKPGSAYEFKFKVTAPSEPGIYFFSWMMCNSNGTFGLGSEMKQILVSQ